MGGCVGRYQQRNLPRRDTTVGNDGEEDRLIKLIDEISKDRAKPTLNQYYDADFKAILKKYSRSLKETFNFSRNDAEILKVWKEKKRFDDVMIQFQPSLHSTLAYRQPDGSNSDDQSGVQSGNIPEIHVHVESNTLPEYLRKASNSLTYIPRNLKEAIDRLIDLKGIDHEQNVNANGSSKKTDANYHAPLSGRQNNTDETLVSRCFGKHYVYNVPPQ
ncbi:hypothetical protein BBBOND_0400800 [Babesia bigemina]|uniref:Uncharacterized protein n=1 Tax=Babesia bigemina TaxID=5866 RepID=A0A061DAL0_BABBI|nr:hypothetical protein BBBOND_0400800 [Babesia bigemina]CDR97588.1 hypothetical protein BBBOND_0400800 [Babesia bigemina]|eukprot:XP_012769774.1 hypothetical protein BBBOND_0400800 [Babesia bigemina]